ncbi:MAG: nucleotidyltransferase domain-containing protein [Candidatus Aenigmarchaeota archaeon]|nr:nucleotidyltransferase domain-containing protein [Candidatus Aenigmarchaeota archaeon]
MWENYNKYMVFKVFLDDPLPKAGFQLREISRMIKLAPKSVGIYLAELEKEGLVIRERQKATGYPVYLANRNNEMFRFYKKLDIVYSIKKGELLDYLHDKTTPDVIVLFGSASRGEDTQESDIDLFVQCSERKLDLTMFEKLLKRKISILFGENFKGLSDELKNNIINGIILKGYLKVF